MQRPWGWSVYWSVRKGKPVSVAQSESRQEEEEDIKLERSQGPYMRSLRAVVRTLD